MKRRCFDENHEKYYRYGGRGITVHPGWKDDFVEFSRWAYENGYADDLTIDRKDNDGNYEPSNCRWATHVQQAHNKSNNVLLSWELDDGQPTLRQRIAAVSSLFTPEELAAEIWKAIPGWVGFEASDVGRVRSYWMNVGWPRSKSNPRMWVLGDEPRPVSRYTRERATVTLHRGQRHRSQLAVAQLVLRAFVGEPAPGMVACHFPDANVENCRLSNLRWDTRSENAKDRGRFNELLREMTRA